MAKAVGRVRILNKEEIKKYVKSSKETAINGFNIGLENGIISKTKQIRLENLGFSLCFRGFNSHSGDCFIYTTNNRYFLSVGMSNINQAGRGYEIQITPTKKLLKQIG